MVEQESQHLSSSPNQVSQGGERQVPSYLGPRTLAHIRRNLGPEWIPASEEISRWTKEYNGDPNLIPRGEVERVRALLPFAGHPFLDRSVRERLAAEDPAKLDELYRECRRHFRRFRKAFKLWDAEGLKPDCLFYV